VCHVIKFSVKKLIAEAGFDYHADTFGPEYLIVCDTGFVPVTFFMFLKR